MGYPGAAITIWPFLSQVGKQHPWRVPQASAESETKRNRNSEGDFPPAANFPVRKPRADAPGLVRGTGLASIWRIERGAVGEEDVDECPSRTDAAYS